MELHYSDKWNKSAAAKRQAHAEGIPVWEMEQCLDVGCLPGWVPLVGGWQPPVPCYPTRDVCTCWDNRAEGNWMGYLLAAASKHTPGLNTKLEVPTIQLVGFKTMRDEIWELYNGIYQLKRSPGPLPYSWEWTEELVQNICTSLKECLQCRQGSTQPKEGPEWGPTSTVSLTIEQSSLRGHERGAVTCVTLPLPKPGGPSVGTGGCPPTGRTLNSLSWLATRARSTAAGAFIAMTIWGGSPGDTWGGTQRPPQVGITLRSHQPFPTKRTKGKTCPISQPHPAEKMGHLPGPGWWVFIWRRLFEGAYGAGIWQRWASRVWLGAPSYPGARVGISPRGPDTHTSYGRGSDLPPEPSMGNYKMSLDWQACHVDTTEWWRN